MPRKPKTRREPTPKEEGEQIVEAAAKAGADYAHEQVGSPHFSDWVHEQIAEAERMRREDPSSVLPDTPTGARKAARNMLQQLEWDTKRQLDTREILELSGASGVFGAGSRDWVKDTYGITVKDVTDTFYVGFDGVLESTSTREWLTDEVLTRGEEMAGGKVGEARQQRQRRITYSDDDIRSLLTNMRRPGRPGQPAWERSAHLKAAAIERGYSGDLNNIDRVSRFLEDIVFPQGVNEAGRQAGMTPEQRSAVVAALRHYGADLTDDDRIVKGDRVFGVRVEVRKGRLRIIQAADGSMLASYPAANIGTGVADFVERFWYWKPVGGGGQATEARRPDRQSAAKAEWMRTFKSESEAFGAHPGQIKWQDAEHLYRQGWTAKAAARSVYGHNP